MVRKKFMNTQDDLDNAGPHSFAEKTPQSVGDCRFSREPDALQVRCPAEIHTFSLNLASESFIGSTPFDGPKSLSPHYSVNR